MYKDKKILCIIPARGGSKGLPGKNIKPLLEKPLICWTIDHALKSEYIDDIFVSTDSQAIADVVSKYGIPVPTLRPSEFASDTSPSSSFILYTIDLLEQKEKFFDYIILLEPTSPLRHADDIDQALQQLINHPSAESVVGVCKVECSHPSFLAKINQNGFLTPYLDELKTLRRQDLDELYYFEGTVYASTINAYRTHKSFYHQNTLPYVVPKRRAFEIDDSEDWFIIESILKNK